MSKLYGTMDTKSITSVLLARNELIRIFTFIVSALVSIVIHCVTISVFHLNKQIIYEGVVRGGMQKVILNHYFSMIMQNQTFTFNTLCFYIISFIPVIHVYLPIEQSL